MGWLKILVWSSACFGLGVASATWRPGGRSLVERAAAGWHSSAPARERLGEGAADLVDAAKRRLWSDDTPSERHSRDDRAAVQQLIDRRGAGRERAGLGERAAR